MNAAPARRSRSVPACKARERRSRPFEPFSVAAIGAIGRGRRALPARRAARRSAARARGRRRGGAGAHEQDEGRRGGSERSGEVGIERKVCGVEPPRLRPVPLHPAAPAAPAAPALSAALRRAGPREICRGLDLRASPYNVVEGDVERREGGAACRGTRRVRLVRGEGRGVSSQYERREGGAAWQRGGGRGAEAERSMPRRAAREGRGRRRAAGGRGAGGRGAGAP